MTNIEKLAAIRDIHAPLHEALVMGAKITIIERRGGRLDGRITTEELADVAIEWLEKNMPHITKLREII